MVILYDYCANIVHYAGDVDTLVRSRYGRRKAGIRQVSLKAMNWSFSDQFVISADRRFQPRASRTGFVRRGLVVA